jgi:hypothetical protein
MHLASKVNAQWTWSGNGSDSTYEHPARPINFPHDMIGMTCVWHAYITSGNWFVPIPTSTYCTTDVALPSNRGAFVVMANYTTNIPAKTGLPSSTTLVEFGY